MKKTREQGNFPLRSRAGGAFAVRNRQAWACPGGWRKGTNISRCDIRFSRT